jgi:hypothetical protein
LATAGDAWPDAYAPMHSPSAQKGRTPRTSTTNTLAAWPTPSVVWPTVTASTISMSEMMTANSIDMIMRASR